MTTEYKKKGMGKIQKSELKHYFRFISKTKD